MAKRLTRRMEDGSVELADATVEEALARLACYEDMHLAIEEQLAVAERKLEERKAAGTLRGAAGNQLLAQKVALKTTLGMFEIYGIED